MSRARSTGARVRVDALTTETRVVDANPDGTFTATVTASPVRMRSGSGWADIDPALADDGTAVRPRMAPLDVSFARGGDARMSTVGDRKGHGIEQWWPYGSLPAPVLSGNQATYPDVLPGVDLVQIAGWDRAGQVFKVKNKEALADPRLKGLRIRLKAAGATVEPDRNGGVAIRGADTGQVELAASKGQWWDTRYPDTSAADPGGPGLSHPFDLGLSTDAKGAASTGIAGAVGDPAGLAFPVYIDPDYTSQRRDFLYVDSAFPAYSYWDAPSYTDGSVHVGFLPAAWDYTYGYNHTTRGFYQFDTTASQGAVILAAKFSVWELWSSSCTPTTVRAYVTGGITPSTNWNSQPGQIQQLDAKTFAYGNSASCPQSAVGFDMMAAKTLLPTTPQWTVGLYADNDTSDPLSWKRFDNGATAGHNAQITITYGHPPNPPKVTAVSGCAKYCTSDSAVGNSGIIRTAGPVFTVSGSDPDVNDGWITAWMSVTKEGEANARWWMGAGQPVWMSPVNGSGSWGYASTGQGTGQALPDGHYKFSVTLVDQQGLVSATTDYWFWVDTAAPPAPQITAPAALASGNDPNGVVGATTYTFTVSAPSSAYPVRGFIYAVTEGGATPPAPDAGMQCGNRTGAFVMVCALGPSSSASFTVAAVDASTSVSAWTVDDAGNIGTCTPSTCPMAPDRSAMSPVTTFAVGKTAPDPARAMDLSDSAAGTSRTGITVSGFSGPSGACATEPVSAFAPEGFSYTGGYSATAAGQAVDSSKSFTASVWACPSGTSPSTVLSQADATGASQLRLGIAADGKWALTTRAADGTETAVEGVNTAPAGQWTLVSAQYDSVNAQLRISASYSNTKDTWVVAVAKPPAAPGTGTQIYLGRKSASDTQSYTGLLVRPVLTQAVLTAQQLQNLWGSTAAGTSQILY
ncbi:LamG-like jellyroll fold domain-containing protein [Sinomonas sp. ASV322]|uniref:LamG-like jellyroll fold domain-containing protein n=1 Tax=Sinomonas sp. ASV322 TaxID=3041920 RepID=UPI0027DABA07|nr:LamG-like jellyroll fold domain-containing protein [Sinomonas sp. ASV322]MDQ4502024.1 LamG-like jellyroll fold domain-containing protein [Sinomonas sp. ASV322]